MAWRFDASTDRVVVPGWTGSTATVLLWVRRVADRGAFSNPIVGHAATDGTGTTRFGVGSDSGGDNLVLFDSTFTNQAGPSLVGNGWVAIAAVMSGTSWTFYYGTDPASLSNTAATRTTLSTVGSFTLSDSTDWFSGDMANLKVFTRALSSSEISAELATYAQVSSTNLVYRATLKGSSTTPETGSAMTAGSTGITVVAGPPALHNIDKAGGGVAGAASSGSKALARQAAVLAFSDYQRSGQSGGTTAVLTSASFTPANGDVIVVKAQTWDTGNAPGAPSGGGQTFTTRVDVAPGGFRPRSRISTAVVSGSPGSMAVSLAAPASSCHHDLTVEVWRNAQLAGSPAVGSANSGSGTAATTVTTTASGSAVSWCAADTASVNPSTRAYLSSATENGFSDGSVGANAVFYSAYQLAFTTGSQSIGLSAPSGQAYTIAGIEVQASGFSTVHVKSGGGAAAGAGTGRSAQTAPAPVAAYSFDGTGTSVTDQSGNGHNFTLANGNARTSTGQGHTNEGVLGSGSGSSGTAIATGTMTWAQTSNRTAMMWMKAPASVTEWALRWNVSSIDSGAWGFLLLNTQVVAQGRNAGGFVRAVADRPTDGLWHHYACTYDGTNVRMYLDGVLTDTQALTAPLRTDADSIDLMFLSSTSTAADDLRIFNQALTAAQITEMMNTSVTSSGSNIDKTGGAVATGAGSGARSTARPKTGGSAATTAGSGPKSVVSRTPIDKTGSAASSAAGSGPKSVSSASFIDKTGGAAATGSATGFKSVSSASLIDKTGGAAGRCAGSGSRTMLRDRAGGAAAGGSGSGSRALSVVVTKTGGAAAGAAGSGSRGFSALVYVKAGGGVAGAAGTGSRNVQHPTVRIKTGSAAGRGAPTGSKVLVPHLVIVKTGGVAARAASSGALYLYEPGSALGIRAGEPSRPHAGAGPPTRGEHLVAGAPALR